MKHFNKIVCVGCPKTGTTSLASAFRKIFRFNIRGYDAGLMLNYIADGDFTPLFAAAENACFFKDWPWRHIYKELDRHFPGSKFILTVRDEQAWVKSFINHINKGQRNGSDRDHRLLRQAVFGFDTAMYRDDPEYLVEHVYRKMNRDVADYFKDRPEDLLVIDVTLDGQWDKLCPFLNLRRPFRRFPRKNVARYTAGRP